MTLRAAHFALFDLDYDELPRARKQIGNIARFVEFMVEFQYDMIAFATINARMFAQEFIDASRVFVAQARFRLSISQNVRCAIFYIVLAIVDAPAWRTVTTLIAITLEVISAS